MSFLPPQLLPHPLSFSFDNTLSFLLLLLVESHRPLLMVCNLLRILSFVVSQAPATSKAADGNGDGCVLVFGC